jgi:hypothetical protein
MMSGSPVAASANRSVASASRTWQSRASSQHPLKDPCVVRRNESGGRSGHRAGGEGMKAEDLTAPERLGLVASGWSPRVSLPSAPRASWLERIEVVDAEEPRACGLPAHPGGRDLSPPGEADRGGGGVDQLMTRWGTSYWFMRRRFASGVERGRPRPLPAPGFRLGRASGGNASGASGGNASGGKTLAAARPPGALRRGPDRGEERPKPPL